MPHFTLQMASDGAIHGAYVGVSHARGQGLSTAGVAAPAYVQVRALLDTGAGCTCVDQRVLAKLGLTPVSDASLSSASTGAMPYTTAEYEVRLVIPASDPDHPHLTFDAIPVLAAPLAVLGIDVLIGRDVLRKCILNYNGAMGLFTLAY